MPDWIKIGIIVLTILTGLAHVAGAGMQEGILVPLFVIDGILFLGLMVAYFWVPQLADKRDLIRWAYIALAAGTIIGYFALHEPRDDLFAVANLIMKGIEAAIIVLLFVDMKKIGDGSSGPDTASSGADSTSSEATAEATEDTD